jgi:hypothetical protein
MILAVIPAMVRSWAVYFCRLALAAEDREAEAATFEVEDEWKRAAAWGVGIDEERREVADAVWLLDIEAPEAAAAASANSTEAVAIDNRDLTRSKGYVEPGEGGQTFE